MKVKNLSYEKGKILNGPLLLDFEPITDNRGYFYEKWNKKKFLEFAPLEFNLVQENISKSYKGVLRGLHYQSDLYAEAKLVRCIKGEIWDVAVDLREHSTTFGSWYSTKLSPDKGNTLFIPEGFAHGFQVLRPNSELLYIHSNIWIKESENGIRFDDPSLAINWPLEPSNISSRDLSLPFLKKVNL